MRFAPHAALLTLLATAPAGAQEGAESPPSLMAANGGLMFWTFAIFIVLFLILRRYAFPAITGAVEAREKALENAIEGAKRDRDEAARILAEQRQAIEAARTDAQRLIADGKAAGERMRTDILAKAQRQQQELLERARREIDVERDRAIAEIRREAVDLAIAGAGRVLERNLDDASNRQLVERFLATIPAQTPKR